MRRALLITAVTLFFAGLAVAGQAQPYPATDVRGLSMGNAYVAAGDGIGSVNYNPALLREGEKVEIVIPAVDARFDDHNQVVDKVDDLNQLDLSAPADILEAARILEDLTEGAGLDGYAYAGVGVGFSALGLGLGLTYAELIDASIAVAAIDTSDPDPNNWVAPVLYGGLEQEQIILTVAKDLGGAVVGANIRYIEGTVYLNQEDVFSDPDFDLSTLKDDFSEESTATALDLGFLFSITPMFDLGLVARDVNEPEFDSPDVPNIPNKVQLEARYRAGVAINLPSVTLAGDVDLNEVESIGGTKYQEWGLGAEVDLWALALRAGLSNNFGLSGAPMVYHAGLGFAIPFFRIDVGAAYGEDGDYYQAGGQMAFKF